MRRWRPAPLACGVLRRREGRRPDADLCSADAYPCESTPNRTCARHHQVPLPRPPSSLSSNAAFGHTDVVLYAAGSVQRDEETARCHLSRSLSVAAEPDPATGVSVSSWDVESSASSSLASLRLYLLRPGNCEAREQRRAWPRTLQCQDLSGVRYILPQAAVQHSVMVGYYDSGKDAGRFTVAWELYKAQVAVGNEFIQELS